MLTVYFKAARASEYCSQEEELYKIFPIKKPLFRPSGSAEIEQNC
jgi:hypothetical protein